MEITVVRLGHRQKRDIRVTTHAALVSRALGAKQFFLCGEKDESVLESVRKIGKRWGGTLKAKYEASPRSLLKRLKKQGNCLIHATMYGETIQSKRKTLQKKRKIAVIIGAEKVPREVYELADYNIAVTNQPHSEIAALAIILDHLQQGKELDKKFSNAQIKIIPNAKGKTVQNKK